MPAMEAHQSRPETQRWTGLRSLALFEAFKGLLVLLVALGLDETLRGGLEETAEHLLFRLHISAQRRLGRVLLDAASDFSSRDQASLAALAVTYSVARIVESWGLWRGRVWAQWFAIGSALLYLPWEIRALWSRPDWTRGALLAGNVLLVLYLAGAWLRNRRS